MLGWLTRLGGFFAGKPPVWADVGSVPALGCVLHSRHAPVHRSSEKHHVIPVAWQIMFPPAKPWPHEGKDPSGRGVLFDARMVECCPTGHRNVHVWITRLMHALAGGGEDPLQAVKTVRAQYGSATARGLEFDTALLALHRWKEAGLSLQELVAAGEWGMSLPAPRRLAPG